MSHLVDVGIQMKSDEEVFELYKELVSTGREAEAKLLRTRFIRLRTLGYEKIEWTPILKLMIQSERNYILYKAAQERVREVSNVWEFDNQKALISRMSGFLTSKISTEEGDIELADEAGITLSRELFMLIKNPSKRFVIDFLFSIYNGGFYTRLAIDKVLLQIQPIYPAINGFRYQYLEKGKVDIEVYDSKLDNDFNLYAVSPSSEDVNVEGLQFALVFMFGYYWHIGNIASAKYFMVKALQITKEEDILYDVLTFLDKEIQ